MRFAVLASPDSWYARDLIRAAGSDHELVILPFSEISATVFPTPSGRRNLTSVTCGNHTLSFFDAVLVRTMPPGSLEQVVFRMDCLAQLEACGGTVINPPRAIEAAVDKFLTTAKLHTNGFFTPRTICCQTPEDAMAAFELLGRDVVLKPLFGSEGRGITRLTDQDLALRAFKMLSQLGAVLYLQEFIPHEGYDTRLFVVGDRVLGMRRINKLDWRTNISRGAVAEAFAPDPTLVKYARRAAAAVHASVAGIDLLGGLDGKLYVIEVNAVPGWKGLAKALDVDVARLVLDFVADEVRRRH